MMYQINDEGAMLKVYSLLYNIQPTFYMKYLKKDLKGESLFFKSLRPWRIHREEIPLRRM